MRFKLNQNGISAYELKLKKRLIAARDILATDLLNDLIIFSPVRTGKLQSSYILTKDVNNVEIRNNCGYAVYVNDGTVYQSGQHFAERAIVDAIALFQRKQKQIINN